jgi:hypothetical protein
MKITKPEFTQALDELIDIEAEVCASFYIPTHEVGGEWRGDRIQLKNLLQDAEQQLEQMDIPEEDIDKLLEPARDMLLDESSWDEMREGLSIFTTPDSNYIFRLPFNVEPEIVIGERFHITPTLPWLAQNGVFYILTLSQNRIRLLECHPEGCEQIDLGPTPTRMQEALEYDDPERRLTLHTSEQQGDRIPSGDPAVFHGHGVGSDNQDANLRRFMQQVAKGVEDHLGAKNAPLLLYGVEENAAMYRDINKYPHLMEAFIHGNPDEKDAAQIADKASETLQDYYRRSQSKALERFNNHRGTDQVVDDLKAVLTHAFQARVAYLFVSIDDHIWGQFDPDTLEIKKNGNAGSKPVDLLNLCAIYTLKHGGEVYALPADEMPVESPVAALIRF